MSLHVADVGEQCAATIMQVYHVFVDLEQRSVPNITWACLVLLTLSRGHTSCCWSYHDRDACSELVEQYRHVLVKPVCPECPGLVEELADARDRCQGRWGRLLWPLPYLGLPRPYMGAVRCWERLSCFLDCTWLTGHHVLVYPDGIRIWNTELV